MKITIECECGNKECQDTKDEVDMEFNDFRVDTQENINYEHEVRIQCLKCNEEEYID